MRGLASCAATPIARAMVAGGNLLTHYNYHRCEATRRTAADRVGGRGSRARRRRRPRRHRQSLRCARCRQDHRFDRARGATIRRSSAVHVRLRARDPRHRRDRGEAHELAPDAGHGRTRSDSRSSTIRSFKRLHPDARRGVSRLRRRLPLGARRSPSRSSRRRGPAHDSGVQQIVRFNWTFYAGATMTVAVILWTIARHRDCSRRSYRPVAAAVVISFWTVASLLASWLVYDRST